MDILHTSAFLPMTSLVWLTVPPPPPANTYIQRRLCWLWGMGRAGERKRERKRKGLLLRQPYKILFFILHSNSNSNTPAYCTIIGILHKLVRARGGEERLTTRETSQNTHFTLGPKLKMQRQNLRQLSAQYSTDIENIFSTLR